MKQAILLTNGAVDMALSLNRWLDTQSAPVDLTIVYSFLLNPTDNLPLRAATYREARLQANTNLTQWLNFLSEPKSNQLRTEILLGEPKLVLMIHLLLRQYDYLLVDSEQQEVLSAFEICRPQIGTRIHFLNTHENALCPVENLRLAS